MKSKVAATFCSPSQRQTALPLSPASIGQLRLCSVTFCRLLTRLMTNDPHVYEARLAPPRARAWVARTQRARMLHRFDAACTLVNQAGDVVSLVAPQVGPGPFSLVLERPVLPDWTVDAPVRIADGTIRIGRTTIHVDTAASWEPRPNWRALRRLPVAARTPKRLAEALQDGVEQVVNAIVARDGRALGRATRRLAGRGPGLTPAGDDALMGIQFALHTWWPERNVPREIADAAAPRTTTLSAAFLRAAADGEAVGAWHDLVSAESHTITGAIDRILAIGATSGADAWSGFVQACTMLRQHAIDHDSRPHSA